MEKRNKNNMEEVKEGEGEERNNNNNNNNKHEEGNEKKLGEGRESKTKKKRRRRKLSYILAPYCGIVNINKMYSVYAQQHFISN